MSENTKGTRVDLGDDLLATRTISYGDQPTPNREPSAPLETIDELLLNAKILLSEGFVEDAKKTLRKVLRVDPTSLSARERLDEIQRIEIKRLLGEGEKSPEGGFVRAKKPKLDFSAEDSELVAEALEREIGPAPTLESQFFSTEEELALFLENLGQLCAGSTVQDRIDLGVAFLEMGFFDAAIQIFRGAVNASRGERKTRALLATAWIAKGKGFDAMVEIDTLVADAAASTEERVEYGYLAGRAQELLWHFETAIRWYRAALQLYPGYRDAEDRLIRAEKMARR